MNSTLRRGLACLVPVALASSFSGCTSEYQGVDLFPIYRDVGDEKAGEFFWLLPPVWKSWKGDESLSWSLPFHLHQSKGEHDELTLIPLIPLWYQQKTLDVETRAIFPLWQRETAGVQNVTKLLLGLGGYTSMDDEPGLRSLTVAPLFGFAKTPGGTNLEFVTTGDILTGKGGRNAVLSGVALDRSVPYFGEQDRPGLAIDVLNVFGGLVQLFHHDDQGTHDETRVLTLFASEPLALFRHRTPHHGAYGSDESGSHFAPFWFDYADKDGRFFSLWPFYGFRTRGEQTIGRYVVWPLLTLRSDDQEQQHGFEGIVKLFGVLEDHGTTDRWLFPLFSVKTSERGHDWRVLLGLFGHAENEERSVLYVLWFPISSDKRSSFEEPKAQDGN